MPRDFDSQNQVILLYGPPHITFTTHRTGWTYPIRKRCSQGQENANDAEKTSSKKTVVLFKAYNFLPPFNATGDLANGKISHDFG